jgi:Glutamine synthetase
MLKEKNNKIRQLPASLRESIEELKSDSDFLKPVFGKLVIERIIEDAANNTWS